MGKFKPARSRKKGPSAPPQGLPCIILIFLAMIGTALVLYMVMKSA
jgi:hypothetical protein